MRRRQLFIIVTSIVISYLIAAVQGCKKTATNKNSADPYIKYNLQRMAGARHWRGENVYLNQDTVIPVSFFNDTTIYICGKPMVFLTASTNDSAVYFGYGPSIYIDGSIYVEYLYRTNKIVLHSMYFQTYPYYAWIDDPYYSTI
jgi:hypothetical protein